MIGNDGDGLSRGLSEDALASYVSYISFRASGHEPAIVTKSPVLGHPAYSARNAKIPRYYTTQTRLTRFENRPSSHKGLLNRPLDPFHPSPGTTLARQPERLDASDAIRG